MSNTTYIEYAFKVNPLQPASDILIAELGEVGFESFVENDEGLLAYIQQEDWTDGILALVQVLRNDLFEIHFDYKTIEQENWNATWEENFEPILVDDKCMVRAPFHKKEEVEYDIVIMPKMSFGTGHHETTHMMLRHVLNHDFNGKSVLDMGSGTGVLAILAALKGAATVDAIDIDHWCFLNAKENVDRNGCGHIHVYEGDVSLLNSQKYHVILANINRNILLNDIPVYASCLHEKGILFLSGFYETDVKVISEKCAEIGLNFQEKSKKGEWVSLKFIKP
ncbi:50S ribosomal protein L11 methyltransferase [Aggregatimonas sangjinii]|uniref:Ribosomal protein L11 methyltransferase n=1 Tax=Aggregatimonas sangjinii TaxID=2583587 RepID=A0A5B7SW34_9FLAO|nr:50S ribosomal protein L11 methyltransferase [Aggregatimonas sangjinii]QCX00884.1 50S ribosomal protein L11 methyltransferase [Aggregatimonas sangjinii]